MKHQKGKNQHLFQEILWRFVNNLWNRNFLPTTAIVGDWISIIIFMAFTVTFSNLSYHFPTARIPEGLFHCWRYTYTPCQTRLLPEENKMDKLPGWNIDIKGGLPNVASSRSQETAFVEARNEEQWIKNEPSGYCDIALVALQPLKWNTHRLSNGL